ncbi:hypothetical protein [Micromonospora zamorensis]|uniref:hypothetical protein n=1 Tax=Micromonospora zamorensis TaxID=709883 RepID=UPI0033A67C20
MSAIASLTVVPRDSITELARLARTSPSSLHSYLAEHGGRARQEYDWSGYCMLYGLTMLITPARRLLDQLDPSAYREDELAAHFDEMGMGFEESGTAGLDTLTLLRDSIAELRDDQVLLLHVG